MQSPRNPALDEDMLDQQALLSQMDPGNTGYAGNAAGVAGTRGLDAPTLAPSVDSPATPSAPFEPPSLVTSAPIGTADGQSRTPPGTPMTPGAPGLTLPDPAAAAADPNTNKYRGSLEGFDSKKFGKQDPKYIAADIIDDYPATPEGWAAMVQDPRFAAAGMKDLGKGNAWIPDGKGGGGPVDLMRGFGAGGQGWQYGSIGGSADGASAQPSGAAPASLSATPSAPSTAATDSIAVPTDADFFNQLMAKMRAGVDGDALSQSVLAQQMRAN